MTLSMMIMRRTASDQGSGDDLRFEWCNGLDMPVCRISAKDNTLVVVNKIYSTEFLLLQHPMKRQDPSQTLVCNYTTDPIPSNEM
jgi:hypothetical protein